MRRVSTQHWGQGELEARRRNQKKRGKVFRKLILILVDKVCSVSGL